MRAGLHTGEAANSDCSAGAVVWNWSWGSETAGLKTKNRPRTSRLVKRYTCFVSLGAAVQCCSQALLVLHQQLPVPFTPPVLASASSMPRPLQVPPMLRGVNVAKPAASLKARRKPSGQMKDYRDNGAAQGLVIAAKCFSERF